LGDDGVARVTAMIQLDEIRVLCPCELRSLLYNAVQNILQTRTNKNITLIRG
jgi:hypothetical protein